MMEERYNLAVERIGDIKEERTVDVKFRDYFVKVAEFIHLIDGTKKKIEDHTFDGMQIGRTGCMEQEALQRYPSGTLPGELCKSGLCGGAAWRSVWKHTQCAVCGNTCSNRVCI